MSIVSRFAPSPTGYLHEGHAFSAWMARARADWLWLRLEDIDATRCRPEFYPAILEDLAWLGIEWQGDVRVQSAHLAEYGAALAGLEARGLLYRCYCTRAEIAAAMSAPHGSGPVYPGTCRHLSPQSREKREALGAPFALRLDMGRALGEAGAGLRFFEEGQGWVAARPERFGDVVLARKEVMASYHLCVVHDDGAQGVTHVVRGEDLRDATHVHVLLQRLLGLETPLYAHHRLLTDATGRRLAKRDQAQTLRAMRAAGVRAETIIGRFEEAL
ncbi:tRNA glutamyl-Q(34) synthetase GluQRS [Acidocella sp.]|uniref:tRNA glutamyl-Q(34) synthetase GluQRS n=1 Tax=Acidocella sp. TaxID=50710 RepID=UPI002603AA1F|nr:tRNA glutamyl-Q(34) synthetase GluQRS [Acidocella sp.]